MRVLIAVDDGDDSVDAVGFAAELLAPETEVTLLNVFTDPVVEPDWYLAGDLSPLGMLPPAVAGSVAGRDADDEDPGEGEESRYSDDPGQPEAAPETRPAGRAEQVAEALHLQAHSEVAHGAVGPTICAFAAEHGIDLIVVGTHDRSRWSRLWFGSVSQYVVEHAPCPVLVVR